MGTGVPRGLPVPSLPRLSPPWSFLVPLGSSWPPLVFPSPSWLPRSARGQVYRVVRLSLFTSPGSFLVLPSYSLLFLAPPDLCWLLLALTECMQTGVQARCACPLLTNLGSFRVLPAPIGSSWPLLVFPGTSWLPWSA